tara:strand:+ start:626 stop:1081 length:456 start_codon:yes stop_codon:yes gene_type:complete
MSTLAIWYTLGKGDVDKNLARVETLFDKSEKPETSWMPMTSPEERKEFLDSLKRTIICERLRRGGDADAKGHSFIHEPLESEQPVGTQRIYRACHKSAPQVAKLKNARAAKPSGIAEKSVRRRTCPGTRWSVQTSTPPQRLKRSGSGAVSG